MSKLTKYEQLHKKTTWAILFGIFVTGCLITLLSKNSFLNTFTSEFLSIVGSILAVGVVMEIIKVYVFEENGWLHGLGRAMYIRKRGAKQLIDTATKVGLKFVYEKMDTNNLFNKANTGDVVSWLDTHDPNLEGVRVSLKSALERGVKVNMLVMDDSSDALEMRARELSWSDASNTSIDFYERQKKFNDDLNKIKKDLGLQFGGNLSVRKYKDLPCAPIFILKKHNGLLLAWSSYFLTKKTSIEESAFFSWQKLADDSSKINVTSLLLDYFEQKWNESDPSHPWESKIHPTGFWVYKFYSEMLNKYVYGKFSIYGQKDGMHAEGEAWYEDDVIGNDDFAYNFRDVRRGLWRSRGELLETVEKYSNSLSFDKFSIPYDLIYQNYQPSNLLGSIKNEPSEQKNVQGHYYLGVFSFSKPVGTEFLPNCFLRGVIKRENKPVLAKAEINHSIKTQFMQDDVNDISEKDTEIYLLRVPQIEISRRNSTRTKGNKCETHWAVWLKEKFQELDTQINSENKL